MNLERTSPFKWKGKGIRSWETRGSRGKSLSLGTRDLECVVVYVMDILTRDSGTQFRYNLITKTSPSCLIDSIHLTDSTNSRHMLQIYKRHAPSSWYYVFLLAKQDIVRLQFLNSIVLYNGNLLALPRPVSDHKHASLKISLLIPTADCVWTTTP